METKYDLILQKRIFRPNFLLSEQFANNIMVIINDRTIARYAMLEQMRHHFSAHPTHVNSINEFAEKYQPKDATYWYTKDSFLHRIINKVLRQGNLEQCFLLRLYISDLSEHLYQLKCQQQKNFTQAKENTILYRGLRQSEERLNVLQNLVGQVIITKGFMSTTSDRSTAMFYAAPSHPQSPQSQSLLIEINVDMTAPGIVAAEIEHLSEFPDEKEVLFDIGIKFKIESLEYDSLHSIWYCRMRAIPNESQIISLPQNVSLNENCLDLNTYSEEEAELERMMSRERRRKHFPTPRNEEDDELWRNSPTVHWIADSIKDRARIIHQKALINWYRTLDAAQFHSESKQSWELYQSDSSGDFTDNHDTALYLNNMGLTCQRLNASNEAIELLKRSFEIRTQIGSSAHFRIQSLRNLGLAYTDQGNYDEALASLKQALIIGYESLPSSQWSTSMTLRNFVYLYHKKGDYRQAIEYYFQALQALEQCTNLKNKSHEK